MDARPHKTPFPQAEQDRLREKAIEKIMRELLPSNGILKIVLIGSSLKGDFGTYEPPGFRGSIYSDFDFIVFVTDDYHIPDWLRREPDGKPFPDDQYNLAYRNHKWLDDLYDVEVFFIRESKARDEEFQQFGEKAGIPMTKNSPHAHVVVFSN